MDLREDLPAIDDDQVKNYDLINDGDLIVADASEDYEGVCKSVEVKNNDSKKAISGLHTFLLRGKGDFFVKGFRGYIRYNPLVKASMDRLATGLKVYGVSKSNLKLIQIPRPSLLEQSAITNVLSDADVLIGQLEKLIEKKKKIRQGTTQKILTGVNRLVGFDGKWQTKNLGEIADLKNGYSFKSSTYEKRGEFLIVTIANVQNGYMDINECNKICDLPSDIQDHQKLKVGDLLISMTGNVGRICLVSQPRCLLNQRVGKIVPLNVDKAFLFYLLKDKKFLKQMIINSQGGAQMNIGKNDILSYECKVPIDLKEQSAIATILSDMDTEIEKLESQLTKYQNIKQGMMQTLLTGKIRLLTK